MLAIKAIVKEGVIKPLEAIDLPEDMGIVSYVPEEKAEDGSSFFFPSAFDFWNDHREDLYQDYLWDESR